MLKRGIYTPIVLLYINLIWFNIISPIFWERHAGERMNACSACWSLGSITSTAGDKGQAPPTRLGRYREQARLAVDDELRDHVEPLLREIHGFICCIFRIKFLLFNKVLCCPELPFKIRDISYELLFLFGFIFVPKIVIFVISIKAIWWHAKSNCFALIYQ